MEDKAIWQGTAALLRSGVTAAYAGHVGALMAALGILYQGVRPGYLIALGAWAYLIYLHVRVALDAELFAWLARGGEASDVDGFLQRVGLIRAPRERSAADRCRGAVGLWRRLLFVLVVELAAGLGGLVIGLQ